MAGKTTSTTTEGAPPTASQQFLALGKLLPKPPDVAKEGEVPGGQYTPCTPIPGTGETLTGGRFLQLQLPFSQGFAIAIKQIRISVPVWLKELALEEETEKVVSEQLFLTEEEARHFAEAHPTVTQRAVGGSLHNPYEAIYEEVTASNFLGKKASRETTVNTKRSVLPVTITIAFRIVGPDGELWTESLEVPIRRMEGAPAAALGTGVVDSFVDLTNPIVLTAGRIYGFGCSVFVPSQVATNVQVGPETGADEPGKGGVTFIYDAVPVPLNK